MNKKKLFSSILAGVLAVSSVIGFGACGPTHAIQQSSVTAYDGSAVTIEFDHAMGQALQNILNRAIKRFNEDYPKITVKATYIGDYDALKSDISTGLAAGKSPHIAYCYPDHVAMYNQSGAVTILDDYINSKDTFTVTNAAGETVEGVMGYTQEQLNDFVPSYYEEGKAFGDGKMYSLPYAKSTEVMFYNATFFKENNLTVPTTWVEMENVCRQIKEITKNEPNANMIFPLGYDSEANLFITQTEQRQTPYTSATGEHFTFNTAENRAFVKMFRDWYDNNLFITSSLSGGSYTSTLFTNTKDTDMKCYMCIGSSGGTSYQIPKPELVDKYDEEGNLVLDANGNPVQEAKYPFEIGIAPIPQFDKNHQKNISQGPSLCMFNKTNPQEMAATWLFMKFLTTDVQLQAEFTSNNGYNPVIKSVNQNPVYQKFLAGNDPKAQACKLANELAKIDGYYYNSPAFVGSSDARVEVEALVKKCLGEKTGSDTVEVFIEKAFKSSIETLKYDY